MNHSLSQPEIAARLMQHRRSLYGYVYACVRDEHAAEDIVQDVAEIALTSASSLRDPERFPNWLFGIARRRVLMHLRSKKKLQLVPPDIVELLAVEAENSSTERAMQRKDALLQCLEELPANMREILRQRYDGSVQDVSELAEQLGRTVQAVYGVLKRLRGKLATCIESKLEGVET